MLHAWFSRIWLVFAALWTAVAAYSLFSDLKHTAQLAGQGVAGTGTAFNLVLLWLLLWAIPTAVFVSLYVFLSPSARQKDWLRQRYAQRLRRPWDDRESD